MKDRLSERLKQALCIDDLIKTYHGRSGKELFECWRDFEEAYLVPESTKPVSFSKMTRGKGPAIKFMKEVLQELGLNQIYIINSI